jgi:hypothetical protein
LTPEFGSSHLYSVVELEKLVNLHALNASMAPQAIRERLLDLDDAEQVELMEQAHANRMGYIPVFEPRQGLAPGADASPAGGGEPAGGPGRPAENAV